MSRNSPRLGGHGARRMLFSTALVGGMASQFACAASSFSSAPVIGGQEQSSVGTVVELASSIQPERKLQLAYADLSCIQHDMAYTPSTGTLASKALMPDRIAIGSGGLSSCAMACAEPLRDCKFYSWQQTSGACLLFGEKAKVSLLPAAYWRSGTKTCESITPMPLATTTLVSVILGTVDIGAAFKEQVTTTQQTVQISVVLPAGQTWGWGAFAAALAITSGLCFYFGKSAKDGGGARVRDTSLESASDASTEEAFTGDEQNSFLRDASTTRDAFTVLGTLPTMQQTLPSGVPLPPAHLITPSARVLPDGHNVTQATYQPNLTYPHAHQPTFH